MITPDSDKKSLGRKVLLMSIKPCYWDRIRDGSKHFELRRTPVKCRFGDRVVVYASAPSKALVGVFEVESVVRESKHDLWSSFGPRLGIARDEYFRYFDGTELATAIKIMRVAELDHVPLRQLRSRWPEFRPPQSFMYWQADHLRHLSLSLPSH